MRTSNARPPFQVECSSQTPTVLPLSRAPYTISEAHHYEIGLEVTGADALLDCIVFAEDTSLSSTVNSVLLFLRIYSIDLLTFNHAFSYSRIHFQTISVRDSNTSVATSVESVPIFLQLCNTRTRIHAFCDGDRHWVVNLTFVSYHAFSKM